MLPMKLYGLSGGEMVDKNALIGNITGKLNELLAGDIGPDRQEIEKNVKAALGAAFSHLELLTRDEFEAQTVVLRRTREKVETLEERISELEKRFLTEGEQK